MHGISILLVLLSGVVMEPTRGFTTLSRTVSSTDQPKLAQGLLHSPVAGFPRNVVRNRGRRPAGPMITREELDDLEFVPEANHTTAQQFVADRIKVFLSNRTMAFEQLEVGVIAASKIQLLLGKVPTV